MRSGGTCWLLPSRVRALLPTKSRPGRGPRWIPRLQPWGSSIRKHSIDHWFFYKFIFTEILQLSRNISRFKCIQPIFLYMAERVRSGQYHVGTVELSRSWDPHKEIGVVKGETANNQNQSGFQRITGLSKSKWYIYEKVEHLRKYADNSGTEVLMVISIEEECDSKNEAVEKAKSRV